VEEYGNGRTIVGPVRLDDGALMVGVETVDGRAGETLVFVEEKKVAELAARKILGDGPEELSTEGDAVGIEAMLVVTTTVEVIEDDSDEVMIGATLAGVRDEAGAEVDASGAIELVVKMGLELKLLLEPEPALELELLLELEPAFELELLLELALLLVLEPTLELVEVVVESVALEVVLAAATTDEEVEEDGAAGSAEELVMQTEGGSEANWAA